MSFIGWAEWRILDQFIATDNKRRSPTCPIIAAARANPRGHDQTVTDRKVKKSKDKKAAPARIAVNKKARFDYAIEDTFQAGLALEGWEVKSLREGRAQVTESYVHLRNGEAWLLGAHITPLSTASTHIHPDPTRTRKLSDAPP